MTGMSVGMTGISVVRTSGMISIAVGARTSVLTSDTTGAKVLAVLGAIAWSRLEVEAVSEGAGIKIAAVEEEDALMMLQIFLNVDLVTTNLSAILIPAYRIPSRHVLTGHI